jgi:hypothetical protein
VTETVADSFLRDSSPRVSTHRIDRTGMLFVFFRHLGFFFYFPLLGPVRIGTDKNCDTMFRKLATTHISPLNFSVLSGVDLKKSPVSSALKMSLSGYPLRILGQTRYQAILLSFHRSQPLLHRSLSRRKCDSN